MAVAAKGCNDGLVSPIRWFAVACLSFTPACGGAAATSQPPLTAADLGEPSDDIDPNVIGAAVRDNTHNFQLCYQSARERNPNLSGLVEIRFVIRPDGSVGPAAVAESSLPKDLSDCIARAFQRLTLPEQSDVVVAQYEMFLDPN